jgi:hypothetical protein
MESVKSDGGLQTWDDAVLHAMSGTGLSRVRTELRLLPPEPINQSLLASSVEPTLLCNQGSSLQSRCPKRICNFAREFRPFKIKSLQSLVTDSFWAASYQLFCRYLPHSLGRLHGRSLGFHASGAE